MIVKLVEDPEMMNQEEEDPDVYYISRTKVIFTWPTGFTNSST